MLHDSAVYLNLQSLVAWSRRVYHASHSPRRACRSSGECWRMRAQSCRVARSVALVASQCQRRCYFPLAPGPSAGTDLGFARELGIALGVWPFVLHALSDCVQCSGACLDAPHRCFARCERSFTRDNLSAVSWAAVGGRALPAAFSVHGLR